MRTSFAASALLLSLASATYAADVIPQCSADERTIVARLSEVGMPIYFAKNYCPLHSTEVRIFSVEMRVKGQVISEPGNELVLMGDEAHLLKGGAIVRSGKIRFGSEKADVVDLSK